MSDKTMIGVDLSKMPKGLWSFGMCISHDYKETYVLISFFKWMVAIGKIYK